MNFEETLEDVVEGRRKPWHSPEELSEQDWTLVAEFGFFKPGYAGPGRLTPDKAQRLVEEVKDWIAHCVEGARENAVFFDTTTVVTAATLVGGSDSERYLTPATLWDLCTFINGTVLYDRVFHLENPHLDSLHINEALGNQPVFIELPVASFDARRDWDGLHSLGALLRGIWDETGHDLRMLGDAKEGHWVYEDRKKIARSWQLLLGRPLPDSKIFPSTFAVDPLSHRWASDGPSLMRKLLSSTEVHQTIVHLPHVGDSVRAEFVQESNHRSMFNSSVAYFLQLPYMSSVARVPFNLFLYERARFVGNQLVSIRWLDERHREVAQAYKTPSMPNLVLPFFPSVLLNRISSLTEFFEALAEVRSESEPLRAHRAELDYQLRRGDSKAANELRAALAQDAKRLRRLYLLAPVISAIGAILPTITSGTPPLVMSTVGLLAAAGVVLSSVGQMAPQIEQLGRRVLSPTYRVLFDMNQGATAMNNALPAIEELWGERVVDEQRKFADKFDRLGRLRYA